MKSWPAPAVPSLPNPEPRAPLLHDTATGRLERTGPQAGTARLYVCGITPYDATHLGHANTYVAFDLLHRVWLDSGLKVSYTQNVTDVDDPLLERAAATGVDWKVLALSQIDLFRDDMTALRVLPPQDYCGAVEAIPELSRVLVGMRDRGEIYQVDDAEFPDWYFPTAAAPSFGQVAKLDAESMVRVFSERGGDPDRPGKRHQLDCLVWRLARPGEPAWPSPLGSGRPGWHIECTTIALKQLGPHFDVQGGGSDLAFPHHEMCAAEGVVLKGEPFARHFVHSGMVGLDGEKMSKSRGNLVLVSQLRRQGVDPMAVRLALLAHHYRSDWFWSESDLGEAQARLTDWRAAVQRASAAPAGPVLAAVREALHDDLNAPLALAAVDAWAAGDGADEGGPAAIRAIVDALLGVAL